ncbi:MAG: NAD(P)H-dependent glycerol-3-phosphate dehydrogenase [Calditrichaceae bacterium]
MKIAVIGAGSWGTTLALVLHSNQHEVRCWTKEEKTIDEVKNNRENTTYLPGIPIPESIAFTMDMEKAVHDVDMVVNAVPSQVTRLVVPEVVKVMNKKDPIWVSVSKGIENKTYLRISEVIHEAGNVPTDKIVILSGPSHAEEVSRQTPTAIVSASSSIKSAKIVQDAFMTPYFRIYANPDVIGVELGGALKNIIALASGICDGAGFGDNTKAALMTRGLVEINRLGLELGASSDTFAGLSGMGDLIVTCMSRHSRNRFVGEQLGKGRKLEDILNGMVMVAEGVKTAISAYEIARQRGVEMPITEQVYLTLFENKSAHEAMYDLMTRASKIEDWG